MAFPTKILLATDGSKDADLVARGAIVLANQSGADLHGVFYVGGSSYPAPERYEVLARQRLDGPVEEVKGAGRTIAEAHLTMESRAGKEDEHIVGRAEELGIDRIVVESRELSGIKHALVGSVSESVVRRAHCPISVM